MEGKELVFYFPRPRVSEPRVSFGVWYLNIVYLPFLLLLCNEKCYFLLICGAGR